MPRPFNPTTTVDTSRRLYTLKQKSPTKTRARRLEQLNRQWTKWNGTVKNELIETAIGG